MVEAGLGISIMPQMLLRDCKAAVKVYPIEPEEYRVVGCLLYTSREQLITTTDFALSRISAIVIIEVLYNFLLVGRPGAKGFVSRHEGLDVYKRQPPHLRHHHRLFRCGRVLGRQAEPLL